METLHEFVARFAASVGCYYHECDSGIFSLKRANTENRREQKVFGWVQERKRAKLFRVDTYKDLAVQAGVVDLADGEKHNMHWGIPGVFYSVNKGSIGDDFQKAVRALKSVLPLR